MKRYILQVIGRDRNIDTLLEKYLAAIKIIKIDKIKGRVVAEMTEEMAGQIGLDHSKLLIEEDVQYRPL